MQWPEFSNCAKMFGAEHYALVLHKFVPIELVQVGCLARKWSNGSEMLKGTKGGARASRGLLMRCNVGRPRQEVESGVTLMEDSSLYPAPVQYC